MSKCTVRATVAERAQRRYDLETSKRSRSRYRELNAKFTVDDTAPDNNNLLTCYKITNM